MSKLYKHTALWSPVILRGSLWIFIAMAKAYVDGIRAAKDQIASWSWVEWSILTVSILIDGAIVLRTFLDQTVARHTDKIQNEKTSINVPVPPNP